MRDFAFRVDHVAITVQGIDRSVGFCRDLLGFDVLGQLLLNEGKEALATKPTRGSRWRHAFAGVLEVTDALLDRRHRQYS